MNLKKRGKIPWVYYENWSGITNGFGKNKSDLGIGGIKNKKKGMRLFRVCELL